MRTSLEFVVIHQLNSMLCMTEMEFNSIPQMTCYKKLVPEFVHICS